MNKAEEILRTPEVVFLYFSGNCGSTWISDVVARQQGWCQPLFEPLQAARAQNWNRNDLEKLYGNILQTGDRSELIRYHQKLYDKKAGAMHVDRIMSAQSYIYKVRPHEIPELMINQVQNHKSIFLYRENPIKHAISEYRRLMGKGHFEHKSLQPAIYVPVEQIQKILLRHSKIQDRMKALCSSMIDITYVYEVSYESFLNKCNDSFQALFSFLCIPFHHSMINSSYKKVTHDSIRNAALNYEELHEAFKHQYGDFFDHA